MKGFGSDNHSGIHPRILASIERANRDHAPSYGTDSWSDEASELMRKIFGPTAETFFVFNGTAANVLALGQMVKSHGAILASQYAHVINDECGAPEKNLGCKIVSVPAPGAKLTPELLKPFLVRRGDQHASQFQAITITQSTELGTVYSQSEIKALSQFAKSERLLLHMDGSRLVNAAASLGCELKEITTDCGVDALSLGGTKNGLLFGEAVIFLKPGLSEDFKYQRKQMMQLPSKTRFIACQFAEFLGTDLWLTNARHANAMAKLLYDGLINSKFAKPTEIPQANAVFATIPKKIVSALRDVAFFYVWNEHTFECRLMTTWDTQPEEIHTFLAAIERLGAAVELAR